MKSVFLENDSPEMHTGYLIWQVTNLRQRALNNALKEFDLTFPQFVVISGIHWLRRSNETVNQVRLIQYTKIDKSVVSSVLKTLEKKEVVIREVDPKDTRAKKLKLSEVGKSKLKMALELISDFDQEFFNPNKLDVQSFNKTLNQLIEDNK